MKILILPFIALMKLVEVIIKMTGRLVAVILGCVFIIIGTILSLTVIGAIFGVPLAILGFVMIVRGFF